MDDLDKRVSALKDAAAAAAQRKAKAEQAQAVAMDRVQQARAGLKAEFGVETEAEAKALLASIEEDLAREAAIVEDQLRKAGAQW